MEKKLQSEIIKFLRSHKIYVIKTTPGAGTPVGCPDIIGLYRGRYLALEVKASAGAGFQPLQRETLNILSIDCKWAFSVTPETWGFVKRLILADFL